MRFSENVTPLQTLIYTSSALLVTILALFCSLFLGPTDTGISDVFAALTGADITDATRAIILQVRLPRALLALVTGGSLAVAGVVFQVLLRNVLAEPYILGVSGGASVGALLAIVTGAAVSAFVLPASAFVGAILVVSLVFSIGRAGGLQDENALLLSGVMIGAFLSAIILALVSTAGPELRGALFWLIGFLGNARMEEVGIAALMSVPVIVVLLFIAPAMNLLTLGQETAGSLGIRFRRVHGILYVAASLLTASVVSFSGSIGFVGLIVPHAVRLIVGPDHRILIPISFFAGASFLIISDIVARMIIAPSELPVGAVTAALGAPLFIYLLRRNTVVKR